MKKLYIILLLIIFSLFGCAQDEAEVMDNIPVLVRSENRDLELDFGDGEPEEDLEGKALNPLTGLYISEEVALRRPVAVMINNLKQALPQSGLGQADLYYEALAEGGIVRILAIFQEFDSEKIGSVRSARHYYLDFALDHDAIYVHHGGSPQAYSAIPNLGIDNLDGIRLEGTAFWRDPERSKRSGMLEHSSYINYENIIAAWEKAGYRLEKKDNTPPMFRFYDEDYVLEGKAAKEIVLPYSYYQTSRFLYDEEEGIYYRFQNNTDHIDEETGEQLAVKNVIIQYANSYVIAGDTEGRLNIDLVSSGKGLLISNGKAEDITWEKTSHHAPTVWKDAKGNPLFLNKGKTWISVVPINLEVELN